MSLRLARLFQPALVIALIVAAVVLAVVLVLLVDGPADEHLFGPFRWIGSGAAFA